MIISTKLITPFVKQCFVVVGVSLLMGELGMIYGISTSMVHQLRTEPSSITIDDEAGSWIASMPGITLILGTLAMPALMGRYGRKKGNIVTIIVMILGWILLIIARNLLTLLIGRVLQGISAGMSLCSMFITIGEYSSPKYRGAFSVLTTCILAGSLLFVHATGVYMKWRIIAIICMSVSVIDLVMVVLSPETPTWLSEHGKIEECRRVFQWLRGEDEEDELEKMIEAINAYNDSNSEPHENSIISTIKQFFSTLTKKEVYKPIIIMIHLYFLGHMAGVNLLSSYLTDLVLLMIGPDADVFAHLVSLGFVRLISSIGAIIIIRRTKRKTMLLSAVVLNILVNLVSAAYLYTRDHNLLPYDHPAIGGFLLYLLMFVNSVGTNPMQYTISSEIFPIKYKSISGAISLLSLGLSLFISLKTFPSFCETIGLAGAYCVYSLIMGYCIVVAWCLLPETKDRTLQDIEDEFKRR